MIDTDTDTQTHTRARTRPPEAHTASTSSGGKKTDFDSNYACHSEQLKPPTTLAGDPTKQTNPSGPRSPSPPAGVREGDGKLWGVVPD